ncbi:restriction endonuclease [Halobacillus sp. MO56]
MAGKRRTKKQQKEMESILQSVLVLLALSMYLFTGSVYIMVISVGTVVTGIIAFLLYRKAIEAEKLKKSGIETIDKMDGLQFEEYLGVLFKNHGYKTEVTQSSGDYGADLILKKDAKKIVVQAKRYSKNVGIKAVQEIHSSKNYYKADEAWVVTNSDFTKAARELADSNKVKLVNREALIDLILTMNGKIDPKETTVKKKKKNISAERIGELGEYKINIQLDQFPTNYKHLHDVMLENTKSRSGYSQIDHLLLTPYAIFVIETKNYAGKVYGRKDDKQWSVNKKFKMMNPFHQNYGHIKAIQSVLKVGESSPFISMISFTRRAVFHISPELRQIQSRTLCVYDTELTEFIDRKIQVIKLKNPKAVYTYEEINSMYDTLVKANITETSKRDHHKQALKASVTKEAKCVVCNKPVSQKVKQFCLSNKKFNGEIYCFEHQKVYEYAACK